MLVKINNWTPFYKYSEDGVGGKMSQQTYEPLISPDGKTFCANYDWQNEYQRKWQLDRVGYTQDVVDYFFFKEVEYAHRFSNCIWAPEIVDVDIANKCIFYKWYGPTCNELIYTGQPLPSDWKSQVRNIMIDAYNSGVYKLTMYPHCHYYDNNGIMHCIDMYGCVEVDDPLIEAKYMDGIIHSTAQFRLDETGELVSGKYNLETMFKKSLGTHVKWGNDDMSFIYEEIFNA
jgi:hypothetical protein